MHREENSSRGDFARIDGRVEHVEVVKSVMGIVRPCAWNGDDTGAQCDRDMLQALAVPREMDETLKRATRRAREYALQTQCPNMRPGLRHSTEVVVGDVQRRGHRDRAVTELVEGKQRRKVVEGDGGIGNSGIAEGGR